MGELDIYRPDARGKMKAEPRLLLLFDTWSGLPESWSDEDATVQNQGLGVGTFNVSLSTFVENG